LTEYALHYPKPQKQVVLVTVKRSAETCEYRNPGPSESRTHGHPEAVMSAAALWISVLQSYGSLKLEALKARLGLSESRDSSQVQSHPSLAARQATTPPTSGRKMSSGRLGPRLKADPYNPGYPGHLEGCCITRPALER
jgi:hypothetical protein